MNNPRTKKALQKFIDDRKNESILDSWFANLFEIDLDKPCDKPYWIHEKESEYENCKVEYIPGYFEPLKIGDTCEIEGMKYKYIESIALPEEQEHQAEDGSLVYEYRGFSFLRLWQPVTD
jgi:hypothetical protein